MNELPERYLFKFRILITDVFVSGCPDGAIHILWKTPTALLLYDQYNLESVENHIQVNSHIEMEQPLTRTPQGEYLSADSELIFMYVSNEIKRPIASLKIDLVNLAEAEILKCVKRFEMNSFIDEEAWISMGVDEVSGVRVMKSEAVNFGYVYEDGEQRQISMEGQGRQGQRQRQDGIREVVSHMNSLVNEEGNQEYFYPKAKSRRSQDVNGRLMRLLEGKNQLISGLEERVEFLIKSVAALQQEKWVQEKSGVERGDGSVQKGTWRRSANETFFSPGSRSVSAGGSQTERNNLRKCPNKTPYQQDNTQPTSQPLLEQNSKLRTRLQQATMRQFSLQSQLTQLQTQLHTLTKQLNTQKQTTSQLKEVKNSLYAQKKNNILIQQQNERLIDKVNSLEKKMAMMVQKGEKAEEETKEVRKPKRKMTMELKDTKETKVEDELGIRAKSFELENQVVMLRLQVESLKKKLAQNEENYEKIFSKETIGLEEKIRIKIDDYKEKLTEETLKHSEEIDKLTRELEQSRGEITRVLKERAYFQKQVEVLKSLHYRSEQRRMVSDGSVVRYEKFKRRCTQYQQMNKKLHLKIQKQQQQLKKKKLTIVQLTQKLNEKQVEWNRLQRLQGDYQKQIDKLINLQSNHASNRRMTAELNSVEMKKVSIEDKVRLLGEELQGLHKNLDELIKDNAGGQIERIEKEIQAREVLLRSRQQELDNLESELLKRKSQMISSDNASQMDLINVRFQQVAQENNELKVQLREIVKRTSLGITEIDPRDHLMDVHIKEKELNVKEQEFHFQVEEISLSLDILEEINEEVFKESIERYRALFEERIKEQKEEIMRMYHRELDLCLREKRIINSESRAEMMEILKRLLNLLETQAYMGTRRRGGTIEDQPQEQSLQLLKKQKQWEAKLYQQRQQNKIQKKKNYQSLQQFQNKIIKQRRSYDTELKASIQKLKTQFQKKLSEKQQEINKIHGDYSNQKVFFDEHNNVNIAQIRKLQAEVEEYRVSNGELEKGVRFWESSAKRLELEVSHLGMKLETKETEKELLERDGEEYRVRMRGEIQDLRGTNEYLQEKSTMEIEILVEEIERLKRIIEESVMKEVGMEEKRQELEAQIEVQEGDILLLSRSLEEKGTNIINLKEELRHEIQTQRICDEEYSALLLQFEEECKKLITLRGEYISLEKLHETAEESIRRLEEKSLHDQERTEIALNEKNRKIDNLNEEYNQKIRAEVQKELEYRTSIKEYEGYTNRLEVHNDGLAQKIEQLENDRVVREGEYKAKLNDLNEVNQDLNNELNEYREKDKKDNKKRLKRPEAQKLNSSRMTPTPTNRSRNYGFAETVRSPILSSSDKDQYGSPTTPMNAGGEEENSRYDRRDSNKSKGEPSSPKFNDSPGEDGREEFRLTVIDVEGKKGEAYEIESPTRERKIDFLPIDNFTALNNSHHHSNRNSNPGNPKLDTDENELAEHVDDRSVEQKESYQQLQDQLQKLRQQIQIQKIEIEEKTRSIYSLQNSKTYLQTELQEIRRNLEISMKKRRQGLDYQEMGEIESYFDYYNRESVGGIDVETFRAIEITAKQLNYLEQQYSKVKEKVGEYQGSIEEMAREIEEISQENQGLRGRIEARQEARELQRVMGEREKEMEKKDMLLENYEGMIEAHVEEREHSNRVMGDLQGDNMRLVKLVESLAQGKSVLEEESERRQVQIEGLVKEKQEIMGVVEELKKEIARMSSELRELQQQAEAEREELEQRIQEITSQFDARGLVIHQLQQQQDKHISSLKQLGTTLLAFQQTHQKQSKKLQQLLLQCSSLTNTNGVLQLKLKELTETLSQREREFGKRIEESEALITGYKESIFKGKREVERLEGEIARLEEEVEGKEVNVRELKNDVEIMGLQMGKMRKEWMEVLGEREEMEGVLKGQVRAAEEQVTEARRSTSELLKQLDTQKLLNTQLSSQLHQLSTISKLRQSDITALQTRYKQTIHTLDQQLKTLQLTSTKQLQKQKQQSLQKFNSNLQQTIQELQSTKKELEQYRREIESERLEMFAKEREFQDTKADFQEQREEYISKIQRYKNEVNSIAYKLKDYEMSKPAVELYEEVAFQNEIFKNRIAELEENLIFNSDFNLEEELELERSRSEMNKKHLILEIENYSKQVIELEKRNYELEGELVDWKLGNYAGLEEENERLEREVARLEQLEEELRLEVTLLKGKREEEYLKMSSEIRQLREKLESKRME